MLKNASSQNGKHSVTHALEAVGSQSTGLGRDQGLVGFEQFCRTCIADDAQPSTREVPIGDLDGTRIPIRLAGHLAHHPVATIGRRENDGRSQRGPRQVSPPKDRIDECRVHFARYASIGGGPATNEGNGLTARLISLGRSSETTPTPTSILETGRKWRGSS